MFAARIDRLFVARREAARLVTVEELDGRPLPVKLRDGVAKLFVPYL
jgi:cardiolipin synthase